MRTAILVAAGVALLASPEARAGCSDSLSCTRTRTTSDTSGTTTSTMTSSITSGTSSTSTTSTSSTSSTAPLLGAAQPEYNECTANRCGPGQTCSDPVPTVDSLEDYICRCLMSGATAVARPATPCDVDECLATPCPEGQLCWDPSRSPARLGDFVCSCLRPGGGSRVGGGVDSCGSATLDECNPSPCPSDQVCSDPNVSPSSRGDYLCRCVNGGAEARGAPVSRCDYDECRSQRCGAGQTCTDPNTSVASLNDFTCRCSSTGATAVGRAVPNCPLLHRPTVTQPASPKWAVGDYVRIPDDEGRAREAVVASKVAWDTRMATTLGKDAEVVGTAGENLRLRFSDGSEWWYPAWFVIQGSRFQPPVGGTGEDDGGQTVSWVVIAVLLAVVVASLCAAAFMWKRRNAPPATPLLHSVPEGEKEALNVPEVDLSPLRPPHARGSGAESPGTEAYYRRRDAAVRFEAQLETLRSLQRFNVK